MCMAGPGRSCGASISSATCRRAQRDRTTSSSSRRRKAMNARADVAQRDCWRYWPAWPERAACTRKDGAEGGGHAPAGRSGSHRCNHAALPAGPGSPRPGAVRRHLRPRRRAGHRRQCTHRPRCACALSSTARSRSASAMQQRGETPRVLFHMETNVHVTFRRTGSRRTQRVLGHLHPGRQGPGRALGAGRRHVGG